MNSGLGVYAVDSDSISDQLNGSNTISVLQAGDGNINFNVQPTWLSGLTTLFQSVLTASSNAYSIRSEPLSARHIKLFLDLVVFQIK